MPVALFWCLVFGNMIWLIALAPFTKKMVWVSATRWVHGCTVQGVSHVSGMALLARPSACLCNSFLMQPSNQAANTVLRQLCVLEPLQADQRASCPPPKQGRLGCGCAVTMVSLCSHTAVVPRARLIRATEYDTRQGGAQGRWR